MRFGNSNESMHGEILSDALKELGIEYKKMKILGSVSRVTPSLEGEKYKVVGMGKVLLIPDKKCAKWLYGKSLDYDIGLNKNFLESINQFYQDWKFRYEF